MSLSPDFKLNFSEFVENDVVLCDKTTKQTSEFYSATSSSQKTDVGDVGQSPKTPTSSGNRIPEIGPCPGAPVKPKSRPNLKRKLVYSDACNFDNNNNNNNNNININVYSSSSSSSNSNNVTRLLDFSKEVEAMFPLSVQVNFGKKIKKARSI